MSERFTAAVHVQDGEAIIDLAGDLDGTAGPALGEAWIAASSGGVDRVVLDFSGTGYMNSTGIALIVELIGRARASGCRLSARGLSPHYRQIFEITRLADFIGIEEAAGAA